MRAFRNNNDVFPYGSIIETMGEGDLLVQPDRVMLTLGVMTEDKDVKRASEKNASLATKVLTSLERIGIPKKQIETQDYRIQPIYDYQEGKSTLKGFRVEHVFKIQLNDVQIAGDVYDTAIKNGANVAGALSFEVEDPSSYYYYTLQKAFENALYKAASLAQTMGVTLNKVPIRVQEQPIHQNGVPYKAELLQASSTPIQAQRVKVQAKLKVWFCYS